MNEQMKKLLALITAAQKNAKAFMTDGEGKDVAKAKTELETCAKLQEEYEVEKALYLADLKAVPEKPQAIAEDSDPETKVFENFVRGDEKELSQGANGGIVPHTIASKIIEQVKELSPILNKVTIYNSNGTLAIPVYGADGTSEIKAAYQGTEFTELTASQGKFTTVDLSGYSIGSLSLISKKLLNNTDIGVGSFVIQRMAQAFANFFEKELLTGEGTEGTSKALTGATKTTNVMTLTTKTLAGITAETLIDLQLEIPEVYQINACWIMNKSVFKAVRKFKDSNGDYIMTKDFTKGFGWELLGKPVYISENMPEVKASSVPVLYGDFKGMALKITKTVEIQMLTEKYATQNAVGVVGWCEADSKIENAQKFIGLKMSA